MEIIDFANTTYKQKWQISNSFFIREQFCRPKTLNSKKEKENNGPTLTQITLKHS